MRLGNILKLKGGTPETGRVVRFQLRVKLRSGQYVRREASAMLLPVSAGAVAELNAEVAEHMADNPNANRADETNLRFLQRALRDEDNLALQFAIEGDLHDLADGLTVHQIAWLIGQYDMMMRDEFPEIWATVKEREKAEDDAEDFSEDGQDS